jgi:thioredoxin reductase (NADPH)
MEKNNTYDLIVIGAGPAGLAVGIEAKKSGLDYLIIDKGSAVNSIRRFPTNMTFFSTPELLEIGGIPFVSADMRPTRIEGIKYYQRVIEFFGLNIRYDEKVEAVQTMESAFSVETIAATYRTKNIVLATGYFDTPNEYSIPGAELPKVSFYYDEPYKYFMRNVAVVGGNNSAAIAALELFRNRVNVTLIHRGQTLREGLKYWIKPDIHNRIQAGEIKAYFNTVVKEIREKSIILQNENENEIEIQNDYVFAMIGYKPDLTLLKSASVRIEELTGEPVHDQNTLETNVPGFFVAGSIAAGKNNNRIFIENGREHGKLIVKKILERSKIGNK